MPNGTYGGVRGRRNSALLDFFEFKVFLSFGRYTLSNIRKDNNRTANNGGT